MPGGRRRLELITPILCSVVVSPLSRRLNTWDIYDDIVAVRVRSRLQGKGGDLRTGTPAEHTQTSAITVRTRVGRPSSSLLGPHLVYN